MGRGTLFAALFLFTLQAFSASPGSVLQQSIYNCKVTSDHDLGVFQVTPAADPCSSYDDPLLLYVYSRKVLYVCEKGRSVMAHFISGGKNGPYKTIQGDKKTPVGIYSLGAPQPSARFGIFIPVGYPNESDQRRNYTGSAIGIHGPNRGNACEASASLFNNWTDGCVAYATDNQIYDVALWVLSHPDAYAVFREK